MITYLIYININNNNTDDDDTDDDTDDDNISNLHKIYYCILLNIENFFPNFGTLETTVGANSFHSSSSAHT